MTIHTFKNCWKFSYMASNHKQAYVKHLRNTYANRPGQAWRTTIRAQDGALIKESYRSDEEMRPIFNYMQHIAECSYYS